ncbi:MAG: thioredoxin family protein [Candidatus Fermentibacteria bacterium]|nr:thioredoxin family protein [Candidatus Fermentibacteria bacterium]
MLRTNLQHVETDAEFKNVIENNENVMISCGRMGPMCLPVYDIMDSVKDNYENVVFRDMDFDGPAGHNIRSLPECSRFNGLPFTVYFKNGKVAAATTSIQNKKQVKEILDREFA